MNKILIILGTLGISLVFLIGIISSYTPPAYNDINLVLDSSYTPPAYNDINLVLGTVPTNSCTYSGSGNWDVNCTDNCSINSNVDLLGNNLTLTGTGHFDLNATISNFSEVIKYDNCQINIYSAGGFN